MLVRSFAFFSLLLAFGLNGNARHYPNVLIIEPDDKNGFRITDFYPTIKMSYPDKFKQGILHFIKGSTPLSPDLPLHASMFHGLNLYTAGTCLNGSGPYRGNSIPRKTEISPETSHKNGYGTRASGKKNHVKVDWGRYEKISDSHPLYKGGFAPYPEMGYGYGRSQISAVKALTGPDTDFPDMVIASAAIKFLEDKHEKPFLLIYGLWRPHTPYRTPWCFNDLFAGMRFEFPQGYIENDRDDVPYLAAGPVNSLQQPGTTIQKSKDLMELFTMRHSATSSFADRTWA